MTEPIHALVSGVIPIPPVVTPVDLILDSTMAVQVAACGHWWQVEVVTGDLADRERRPILWAPLAHCRECEQVNLLRQLLEAIRGQVTDEFSTEKAVGNIAKLLQSLEEGDLPEPHDNAVRAVAALVSWDAGDVNRRTAQLAHCLRTPQCPYGTGHPGVCGEGGLAAVGPSPATRDGRTAIVRSTIDDVTYVFPVSLIHGLAEVVMDGRPAPAHYAPEYAETTPEQREAADLSDVLRERLDDMGPTERMVEDWAIHQDHVDVDILRAPHVD